MSASHTPGWWVRHAGREAGPYDTERLRTLARRGALTRFHQLSSDGAQWSAATDVRAVFNADGSVVDSGAALAAGDLPPMAVNPSADAEWRAMPGEDAALATDAGRKAAGAVAGTLASGAASGRVSVRAAQFTAMMAVSMALAAPTGQRADGSVQWWIDDQPLVAGTCALSAIAAAAWWATAWLAPSTVRSSALTAVSAVLAASAGALFYPWATSVVPVVPVLPAIAALIACESHGAPHVRVLGRAVAAACALGTAASIALVAQNPWPWGIGAVALMMPACLLLLVAGAGDGRNARTRFVAAVTACALLGAALFAAAVGGLCSADPLLGARGAIGALLCVGFTVLTWVGAHGAMTAAPEIQPQHTP